HDALLELRQHDRNDDERKRQRCRSRRTAQQGEPEKIQKAPGEQERRLRRPVLLGPQQYGEGCNLEQRKRGKLRENPQAIGRESTPQEYGNRQEETPPGLSQFCNSIVMIGKGRAPMLRQKPRPL